MLLRATRSLAILAVAALLGCHREVAAGLDEPEANRAVVALARAGVDAEKEPDPSAEGRFRLTVSRDEATIAISVLAGEEIPRPKVAGVQGSPLVASAESERVARIVATAAQLERSLAAIEGVHDARVHLDVPLVDALGAALAGDGKAQKPTASVLLRHRGSAAPIVEADIRKLVAGAVSGLEPANVAVVIVATAKPSTAGDREIAHLGPLAVTRGSLGTLKLVAGTALGLLVLLSAAVLFLMTRLRGTREAETVQ